jgi:hypothetical protein
MLKKLIFTVLFLCVALQCHAGFKEAGIKIEFPKALNIKGYADFEFWQNSGIELGVGFIFSKGEIVLNPELNYYNTFYEYGSFFTKIHAGLYSFVQPGKEDSFLAGSIKLDLGYRSDGMTAVSLNPGILFAPQVKESFESFFLPDFGVSCGQRLF